VNRWSKIFLRVLGRERLLFFSLSHDGRQLPQISTDSPELLVDGECVGLKARYGGRSKIPPGEG